MQLLPSYLEQLHSQPSHVEGYLVDSMADIVTCKHAELIAKDLHANPALRPFLLQVLSSKQLEKEKHAEIQFEFM